MSYDDLETANAFAESWNRLPAGSAYTRAQFEEWMAPLDLESVRDQTVLELGFGNGSLLYHMARCGPALLCGVELGDTLETARRNVGEVSGTRIELYREDLTRADLGTFDFVYCIGVLHHLKEPEAGFDAVLRHTRPGGRFHCWVYAREGNAVVRYFVDPLRRVVRPRLWAGIIAMPILAQIFNVVAILGAVAVGVDWLGVDAGSFWANMQSAVEFREDVLNGLIKSLVFGAVVTWIAVFQGYDAMPTSEGISAATPSALTAATALCDQLIDDESELVTVLLGADARQVDAGKLREHLGLEHPHVEVEVHEGGQPLYPFLIGVD